MLLFVVACSAFFLFALVAAEQGVGVSGKQQHAEAPHHDEHDEHEHGHDEHDHDHHHEEEADTHHGEVKKVHAEDSSHHEEHDDHGHAKKDGHQHAPGHKCPHDHHNVARQLRSLEHDHAGHSHVRRDEGEYALLVSSRADTSFQRVRCGSKEVLQADSDHLAVSAVVLVIMCTNLLLMCAHIGLGCMHSGQRYSSARRLWRSCLFCRSTGVSKADPS